MKPVNVSDINTGLSVPVGLHPQHMWRCYKLESHPGLVVIRNAFTVSGQRYWIARCLRDYPKEPNVVNLNRTLFSDAAICDWWRELHQCTDPSERDRLKVAMRWTTLGYHHNWDTKVYNETMRTEFPYDLNNMCQFFSCALGFSNFIPQAAIVNYYPMGTNLSGHTDHSELNLNAPLFSFRYISVNCIKRSAFPKIYFLYPSTIVQNGYNISFEQMYVTGRKMRLRPQQVYKFIVT